MKVQRPYAGERERRRARATGSVVVLLDTHDPECDLDPEGGRWATLCDDHSTICNHPTRRVARHHMPRPDGWCEECRPRVDVSWVRKPRHEPVASPCGRFLLHDGPDEDRSRALPPGPFPR